MVMKFMPKKPNITFANLKLNCFYASPQSAVCYVTKMYMNNNNTQANTRYAIVFIFKESQDTGSTTLFDTKEALIEALNVRNYKPMDVELHEI